MSVLPALDVTSGTSSTVRTGIQRIWGCLQEGSVVASSEASTQAGLTKGRVHLDITLRGELEAKLLSQLGALDSALGLVTEKRFILGGAVLKVKSETDLVRAQDELGDPAAVDRHRCRRPDGSLKSVDLGAISICIDGHRLGKLCGVTGDVQSNRQRGDIVDGQDTG